MPWICTESFEFCDSNRGYYSGNMRMWENLPGRELSHADDFTLMAESDQSLREKIVNWKISTGMEVNVLKLNTGNHISQCTDNG